jgi:hypothetical protein
MSGSLRLRVAPLLIILAIGTANTGASTGPRYVQCLFDLSIEELMEIQIGAELRLGYWTSPDKGPSDAERGDLEVTSNDVSQPKAAGLHDLSGGQAAEANKPVFTWNK